MPNPHHDLTAVVMQNNDWMSSITNLKPQFIKGNSFQYQQMIGTQFGVIMNLDFLIFEAFSPPQWSEKREKYRWPKAYLADFE